MHPLGHRSTTHRERGFSLVEVIIAMTVLSIVIGGAAVAVVSSDTVETKSKAVADSHAMAEKAVEELRQDLTARTWCDTNGAGPRWKNAATAAKTSGSAAEVNFAPCRRTYPAMTDAKGRQYQVRFTIEPKDRADDGFGSRDIDGDVRDVYEIETEVVLAANSRAGRENSTPIRVGGTIDWETGATDSATVRVIACAIDRPDRALIAGGCASSDPSRQSLTVTVPVSRIDESTGAASNAGNIISGGAPASLDPGSYRFNPPGSVGQFDLLKLDPQNLRANGSQNYTVQATYVRRDLRTRVCTQVAYWDTQPEDDGYEIVATNIHWRRTRQSGFRSARLALNGDNNPARGFQNGNGNNRSWNCTRVLLDPVEAVASCPQDATTTSAQCPSLFRGLYDIEVEQVEHFTNPRYAPSGKWGRFKLQVIEARMNCRLQNWNQPMGGTALIGRGADGSYERPDSPNKNKSSWYARMPITATTGTQTLCIRFHSKPFERTRCYDTATAGVYNRDKFNQPIGGCFYVGTTCRLPAGTVDNDNNCWNGADVCASCGSGGRQGVAGPVQSTRRAGGVSGGPNDGTVACNTGTSYVWPGSRRLGVGSGTDLAMGTILSTNWVGGSSSYYANFNGRASAQAGHSYGVHPDRFTYNLPDNPPYFCTGSYFSLASGLFAGNGGPYRYYECLEVQVPGRPYKVRGRVYDVSGSGTTFYLTVGAALQMAPDSSRIQDHWNPFGNGSNGFPDVTGGGNWPNMNISRVTGDPDCGAPVVHVDPIIEEIWEKVIDETGTRPLPPPAAKTNLGSDRIGV